MQGWSRHILRSHQRIWRCLPIRIPQGTREESDTRGNIVAGWWVVSTRKVGPNHTAQADRAVKNAMLFGAKEQSIILARGGSFSKSSASSLGRCTYMDIESSWMIYIEWYWMILKMDGIDKWKIHNLKIPAPKTWSRATPKRVRTSDERNRLCLYKSTTGGNRQRLRFCFHLQPRKLTAGRWFSFSIEWFCTFHVMIFRGCNASQSNQCY